jgi:hypothetical protein
MAIPGPESARSKSNISGVTALPAFQDQPVLANG